MLISDDMEQCDETESVIYEFNHNRSVIIFSYVIGASEANIQTLEAISCSNGAKAYRFRTVGMISKYIFG